MRVVEDLAGVLHGRRRHPDGVVVPKVDRRPDVRAVIATVADAERDHGFDDGSIEVTAIVETAASVSDLREITHLDEDHRLARLVFGPVDSTADLGGRARGTGRLGGADCTNGSPTRRRPE
ncbi:MAG: aldolase/citrate lyase family protein [Halosimplex sp.]